MTNLTPQKQSAEEKRMEEMNLLRMKVRESLVNFLAYCREENLDGRTRMINYEEWADALVLVFIDAGWGNVSHARQEEADKINNEWYATMKDRVDKTSFERGRQGAFEEAENGVKIIKGGHSSPHYRNACDFILTCLSALRTKGQEKETK